MQYGFDPMQRINAERELNEKKYNRSRYTLLLIIGFTLANIQFLLIETNLYFLFSAFIPYFIVDLGMLLCGKYPSEYYTDELADMEFFDPSFLTVMVIIAIGIIVFYLLFFLLSKNMKYGWLIAALVFFSVDTLCMFMTVGLSIEFLIDLAFHAWVIFELSLGIHTSVKSKALEVTAPLDPYQQYQPYQPYQPVYPQAPAAPIPTPESDTSESNTTSTVSAAPYPQIPDSPILRDADFSVKSRILLEAEFYGLSIVYRRVKKVNELVINGKVYAEYTALIETAHTLRAQVNGHYVEAGHDGAFHSYINLNGNQIAKKVRWY